jgi:hypothetical protein
MAFNYHSYANSFNFPWGYQSNLLTPDHDDFVAFSKEMSLFNNYIYGTPSQTLGYTTNGYSNDWFYGEQTLKGKAFSWTVEVGSSSDGFWPNPNRIVPLAQGNIYNNLVLAWGVQGAPPAINVRVTPNNPPITIPAQGGSFTFHVELENNSGSDQNVRIWNAFVRTDKLRMESAVSFNIPLAQGQVFTQNFTQNISAGMAPGEYAYKISVGLFPAVIDIDGFNFTKEGP